MKNSITIIWLQFTYYNVQNLTEFDIDEGILMWEQVILLVCLLVILIENWNSQLTTSIGLFQKTKAPRWRNTTALKTVLKEGVNVGSFSYMYRTTQNQS